MKIRKIDASDKSELLEIMTDFYNSPALLYHTPRETLSRVIDDCISDMPFIEGFVGIENGKIACYTMLSVGYSTEYGGLSIFVEDLFVLPEHRGKGYGKTLLEHIENKYKDRAARLRLEVEKDNIGAVKLYERCGYSEIAYKQMGKTLL